MRNHTGAQRPTLRRLAKVLLSVALIAGVLPATSATASATRTGPQAAAATWTKVATIDAAHTYTATSELIFFGAYGFSAELVNFDPHRIPASVPQLVAPYIVVPDASAHVYRLVFHLYTDVTTTSSYQLDSRAPVALAGGARDLEFTDTVQLTGRTWHGWTLRNATGDHWFFYGCDIYLQTA